jgi:hypothetical protein
MSDIASNDVALVFSTWSILSQNKENVQPPPTLTLRNAELGPVLQARSAVSDIQRLRFVSAAEMRPERPPPCHASASGKIAKRLDPLPRVCTKYAQDARLSGSCPIRMSRLTCFAPRGGGNRMSQHVRQVLFRGGTLCRRSASTLITGLWPGRSLHDVDDALAALPVSQQAAITSGVFLGLVMAGLFAAQFGWIGILLFWLAVIVIAQ